MQLKEMPLLLTNQQQNTTDGRWKGFHLILPSVGISNVGQLAVDMFLFNLGDKVKRISGIYDEALMPVTGVDHIGSCADGNNGPLLEPMEVFESAELKLVIIQQRAPFVKGRIPTFRERLSRWIDACGFERVVMLSGVSSHVKTDKDLTQKSPFRFLCNQDDLKHSMVTEHDWLEYSIKKTFQHKETLELPGSGIVKSMFEDSVASQDSTSSATFIAMLVFCNQGDAKAEINVLLSHLKDLYADKMLKEFVQPPYWRTTSAYNSDLMLF